MRLTIKNYHKPVGCLLGRHEEHDWYVKAAIETSSNYQFVCGNDVGEQYLICLERESSGAHPNYLTWAFERPAGMTQSNVSSEYFGDMKNVLASLSTELWECHLRYKTYNKYKTYNTI